MGILDDAIRQHLDLKRRLGAEEEELKRLEDEAFGPPTRPGDPDFPETDPGVSAAVAEAPAAESPAIDSPPDAVPDEPQVTEPDEATSPPPDLPADPGPDTGEEMVEPPAEPEPTDPGASESADEPEAATAFYDQSPETSEAPLAEPAAPEPAAPQATEEHVLEQAPLDIDEPPAGEATTGGEEASATELVNEPLSDELPAAPQPGEPPIESLDTVEHHFEGAIEDTGEAELVEGEIAEEEGEGSEDVLDQTPEFLRDQPEDDELWFEQGEPKDFDF